MMGSARQMDRRIGCLWLATVVLVIGGCCRGTGTDTAHRCHFTPPDEPGADGGTDGPIPCGTAICDPGKVCCYKQSPAVALCIDPAQFIPLACEKMDLPCFSPKDCPGGGALSCCVNFTEAGGTVTCRPPATCLGEGAY